MAFWKKKSEDPWDMDPNKKRNRAVYHEREIELPSEPVPQPVSRTRKQEDEGLAMPESAAEPEVQEEPEIGPECPWCGQPMTRAYLLGGQNLLCFTEQRPRVFWGSLGHEKTYLGDDVGFWSGSGSYQSCWQCKPCYKLVIDIPKPDMVMDGNATLEGRTFWDGNPVAPPGPEEIEP